MNKHDTPVLNPENALKLGVFAINLRGGVTLADVDVEGTWDENVRRLLPPHRRVWRPRT
jgi:hypothetical protein